MWYEGNQEDKVSYYSKFSLDDFWNYWCGSQTKYMEVRIKDFDLIKQLNKRFYLPYSSSGVYVKNALELKKVIAVTRNHATMWFGVNSRKRNYNKWKSMRFGGKDQNVEQIDFIFIDIDRKVKDGPATNQDLKDCDDMANHILERLGEHNWSESYMKICSGNGIQLLIELDIPIKLPELKFIENGDTGYFEFSEDFIKMQKLLPKGIGDEIVKYSKKFNMTVEIDKTGFNIGRVAALPFTKNYKHDSFTWRGIVDIKKGVNTGLTDYILSKMDEQEKSYTKRVKINKGITPKNKIKNIYDNRLAMFLLENNFPEGGINNTLWFQLKCLIRDSNYDMNKTEFIEYHQKICAKHGRTFTLNLPEKTFAFDENVVNAYCVNHLMPPIYEVYPHRNKKLNMNLENFDFEDRNTLFFYGDLDFIMDENILKTAKNFNRHLKVGDYANREKYATFLRRCVMGYGLEITKYYHDHIFYKLFTFTK